MENKTAVTTNRVTDFSLGIFGTSDNFIMAKNMAAYLAASTIVPKDYQKNEANCLVALEMAVRIGTSPLIVMQNLDIIYGRPSWRAQYIIAMINGSGKYDIELQYDQKEKNGKPFSCQCWTMKDGRKVSGPVIDMDMVKAEQWIDKNGSKWKTMPQIMLMYRAASFFGRLNCPELIMGLYSDDEVKEMGKEEKYVESEVFNPFSGAIPGTNDAQNVIEQKPEPAGTDVLNAEQASLNLETEKSE